MPNQITDLKLSTKKSLHRPLVIEVEGIQYTSKPIVKPLFDKLTELQAKGEAGDSDAAYEQIKLVFGVPKKALYEIDMRDISLITNLVSDTLLKSENYRSDVEKNGSGSGDKSSA